MPIVKGLSPYVMTALGVLVVLVHGGLFYNAVAFQAIFKTDPAFSPYIKSDPEILTDGTAYYIIGDIVGGSVLNPLMDLIGPRRFTMFGNVVNFVSYAIMAFAPRHLAHMWLAPTMLAFGCALQMIVNPTMLIGNLFGPGSASLIVIFLGASCEFALPMTTFWVWTGASVAEGCIFLMVVCLFTFAFAYLCYGDSYEEFENPKPSLQDDQRSLDVYRDANPDEDIPMIPKKKLGDVLREPRFIRIVMAYFLLFFVFQCQTTFWSATLGSSKVLNTAFYVGSFLSVVFGISTGLVAQYLSALTVSKYYYLASTMVCLALAEERVWAMLPATFVYFTFKSCIFTVWFAIVNESFACNNIGTLFAIPQFMSSGVFWTFNHVLGPLMAGQPNQQTRLVWLCLSALMFAAFVGTAGLKPGQSVHVASKQALMV